MKKIKLFALSVALIGAMGLRAQCNLVAVPDPTSLYEPTQIENGGFETEPTMAGSGANRIPNGTNQGWNTTETHNDMDFEWCSSLYWHTPELSPIGNYCVEMNAYNSATLYQDLYTNGGDVIRWSLAHAARTSCGEEQQDMRVEVGAPLYDNGNIVYPSGINEYINTNIDAATKATFRSSGITNPTGNTYGFNGQNLGYLSLKQSDPIQWYYSTGVYVVPVNQPVTRFAFVSEDTESPDCGNLLDEISFSTLIGDLSATYGDNNSVVIKGYWGETDTSKKLIIDINGTTYNVDMTSVSGQNFVITMTEACYDNTPSDIKIYHEDYESAARTLSVHYSGFDITANLDPQNAGVYYSTFYHGSVDYALPANVEAYKAVISGSDLLLSEVAAEGDVLPKGNAVILRSSDQNYTLTPSDATPVSVGDDNALEGVDIEKAVTSIAGLTTTNCYVLSGTNENGVGFYRINSNNLKAHKAYVKYSGTQNNAPRRMRFVFEQENTTTGMENVQGDNVQSTKVLENGVLYIIKNGVRYNAQGQAVK